MTYPILVIQLASAVVHNTTYYELLQFP